LPVLLNDYQKIDAKSYKLVVWKRKIFVF